jgi:hypothetical protein
MKRFLWAFTLCLLCATYGTATRADSCRGLENFKAQSAAFEQLKAAIASIFSANTEPVECGSLVSVLGSVSNLSKPGGRRLEEDRPFNPAQAQANLKQAEADPEVHQRLEHIRKTFKDPTQSLLYQAAALDEEGYYPARDLLVGQLRQKLN